MARQRDIEKQEALERLREWIKPGDTIYCVLRSVSRSGMSRVIDLKGIGEGDGSTYGWNAAKALGMTYDQKREGVKIGGCGMDMGFALVYDLSHALFPQGFGCIGKAPEGPWCPSNDHSNGDHDYRPHEDHITSADHVCATNPDTCTALKHWHRDGGYALRHRWL